MSVVVVGAYTRDLYMFGPRLPTAGESVECREYAESHGGKAANQAVAAARLGAPTVLITRLGRDRGGETARRLFEQEGVDCRHVSWDGEAGTGVSFIILDPTGLQLITTYAGASDRLTAAEIHQAAPALRDASALLLQGEISAELSLLAAQLAGEQSAVILDPSPVETFMGRSGWDHIDILTPNVPEARVLVGRADPDAASVAAATGVATVILTRGAAGVEVYRHGQTQTIPAPAVRAVDTTGAGDAFNGALAAGLARGLDLMAAAAHACQCAAFSVGRRFCIPAFPSVRDVPW